MSELFLLFAGQKDIENYKKECNEKTRKSLQFRGKEKRMQRLNQYNEKVKQRETDHKNFELDSACWARDTKW